MKSPNKSLDRLVAAFLQLVLCQVLSATLVRAQLPPPQSKMSLDSAPGQGMTSASEGQYPASVHRLVAHAPAAIEAALQKAQDPSSICGQTITYWKPTFLYNWNMSQINANDAGFGYTQTIKWSNGWGWRHDAATFDFQFANLRHVTVEPAGSGFRVVLQLLGDRSMMCVANGRMTWLVWNREEDAKTFAEAVNWLVWQNSPEGKAKKAREENSERAYHEQIEAWQKAVVKPTMPDAAHVHEVLAKNAVQEKQLARAVNEYEAALEIFPTWPDGQFNVAMICGETGDYGCAVDHMQHYLELVPDAADAQAAKDKLIIWRDKLQSSQALGPQDTTSQKTPQNK